MIEIVTMLDVLFPNFRNVLDVFDTSRSSALLYGIAVLAFGGVFRLFSRRSNKLPLPYFYVKDSVVATLEEAHRQVRQLEPRN